MRRGGEAAGAAAINDPDREARALALPWDLVRPAAGDRAPGAVVGFVDDQVTESDCTAQQQQGEENQYEQ
jgi:hypothetical protein